MKKRAVSSLFLLTLGASACIKGKNAPYTAPTPKQTLAGNWQLTAYTTDTALPGQTTGAKDAYTQLPPCRQDDIFEFGTDGILLLNDAAQSCDSAGNGSSVLGYWKLLEAPSALMMDDPDLPGAIDTLVVESLNDSLVLLRNRSVFPVAGSSLQQEVTLRKTYRKKK